MNIDQRVEIAKRLLNTLSSEEVQTTFLNAGYDPGYPMKIAKWNQNYKCGHSKQLQAELKYSLEDIIDKLSQNICEKCRRDIIKNEVLNG